MTPRYLPQDWEEDHDELTRAEWLTLIAWLLPIGVILWAVIYGVLEWLF